MLCDNPKVILFYTVSGLRGAVCRTTFDYFGFIALYIKTGKQNK